MIKGERVWFLIEEHGLGSVPSMIGNLNIRTEIITQVIGEYITVEHIDGSFMGEDTYESKKDVINALKQLINEMEKQCSHKSDGHLYVDKTNLRPRDFIKFQMKCLKCGEFYK